MRILLFFFSGLNALAAVPNAPLSEDAPFTLESAMTLRDPFRRPELKTAMAIDEGGLIPELERYELDKFKLVGVITGAKKNKALLTAPNGKMHVVSDKTVLGNRRGYIKRILPGMIVIEEKVVNLLGQEERIETVIAIKDPKNDKDKESAL